MGLYMRPLKYTLNASTAIISPLGPNNTIVVVCTKLVIHGILNVIVAVLGVRGSNSRIIVYNTMLFCFDSGTKKRSTMAKWAPY